MKKSVDKQSQTDAFDFPSNFAQWCQMTAYHGVLDLYLAKGILAKTAWLTVLSFGFFLAINQSAELILDFVMEDQWVTTVSTELAQNGAVKWPNIMICKISWSDLRTQELKNRKLDDPYDIAYFINGREGVLFHDRYQSLGTNFNQSQLKQRIDQLQKKFNCSFGYCLEEPDRIDCDQTIIDCGGGPGGIHSHMFCNCSKYASNTTASECFKVNATEIIGDKPYAYSNGVGYYSGVYVLLNPAIDDYYPNLVKDDEHAAAGLRVGIYFDEEEASGLISPILLWPGSQTAISMTPRKHRVRVRSRRSISFYELDTPCSVKGDYKWFNTQTPSRHLCQLDCWVQFCMEYVNCVTDVFSSFAKNDENYQKCTKDQRTTCSKDRSLLQSRAFPSGFNLTYCDDSCKDPCEIDFVTTTVTTAQFPAPSKLASYVTYLNRVPSTENGDPRFNFTRSQVQQLILLNLFFDRKEYKVTEKVNRVSIDELISSIGGVLGVWTGISLISVLQAVVYAARGFISLVTWPKTWSATR